MTEIKTDDEYFEGLDEVKRLWHSIDPDERQKLEELTEAMHNYERKREPLPALTLSAHSQFIVNTLKSVTSMHKEDVRDFAKDDLLGYTDQMFEKAWGQLYMDGKLEGSRTGIFHYELDGKPRVPQGYGPSFDTAYSF